MQGQEPQLPKLTKRQAISACPEALQSHLEGDHQSLQTRYAGMCDHLQPHYHEQVLDFPPKNGEVQPTLAGVGGGGMIALFVVIHVSLHTVLYVCKGFHNHPM